MIDSLIAGLSKELELSAEEIADTIWLALQIQESPSESTATENFDSSQSPLKREESAREVLPETQDEISNSEERDRVQSLDEPKAGIYPRKQNETLLNSGLSFKVPDAPSLREPLTLARALKPLMRRIPSGTTLVFDEAATTQRIADEGLWLPVLRPTLEPWFDLELVVDEAISMQIWRPTVRELERLLKNYGIFRDVRVWGLIADENEQLQIRRGIGATTKNRSPRSPAELIDPSGRRLVLVVSDCVSSLWRNGKLTTTLELWAKQGSMAIVQMLPKWLWKRTALGRASEVCLQGLNPGEFNQKLIAKEVSLWDDLEEMRGVKVPVFTLEPDKVANWAQMLSGKGNIWTSGYVFKLDAIPVSKGRELLNINYGQLSAEQRVQAFRVTASPMARKLAGLLAAAPVISLPIVRLIQETLLKESQQVHVAEVFLGGLLKPLSEINPETNPNYVQYEFMDGVRELFVDSVPSGYVLNVVDKVSKYVAKKVGLSLEDFAAVLRNPQQVGDSEIAGDVGYFATATAKILRHLGGEYARFAEELESYNRPELRKNVTADLNSLVDVDYQIGGSLPPDSPSYIKRKADDELYNAVKRGHFCIVSAPRQMGKSSLNYQVIKRLRQEGIACASIDLSIIGIPEITPREWYIGLIHVVTHAFELSQKFNWVKWLNEREQLSPATLFNKFIDDVLLKEIPESIVIFLDEFDMTLSLNFREDFFHLLRALYVKRAERNHYDRLTFVLSGVFPDNDLSQNIIVSPLTNITYSIKLEGFSYEEALLLAGGLTGKTNNPQALLREILEWTGGQPFLTQKLCWLVKKSENHVLEGSEKAWLENLVRTKIINHWEEQDDPVHLQTIKNRILSQETSKLLNLYKSILQREEHFDRESVSKAIHKLILIGLLVRRDGKLEIANKIYAEVFDREWVERNLAKLTNIKSNSNQEIDYDYAQLRNLLAEGKWKEADRETFRIMLKITNREKDGTLDYQAIQNASCMELNTIDKLWIEASGGRFGFSIQLEKWKKSGGKTDRETEYKLGHDIGWYVNNKWLSDISEFTFNLSAPIGHLPVEWTFYLGGIFPRRKEAILFSDLANRLLTCKINNLKEYTKQKWQEFLHEAIQDTDKYYDVYNDVYNDLWTQRVEANLQ
jgi:GUN4-like/AAA-like domain